jgi:hypothetical protein
MLLTPEAWAELIELGVLEGDAACALCRERPQILVDVAREPVLLCALHARAVAQTIQIDLQELAGPLAAA